MTITWGPNQTQTFTPGTTAASTPPAPAPSFGAPPPTPAPASSFFGSSSSTPASGGLFGSAPSPGLFGSAPAPATGLFGSAPTPAPTTGLFGSSSTTPAPATGLFGSASSPAPGSFFGASTPAPAASSFSFGSTTSPAPAASSFSFGSTTTTTPGGLFGTPTPAPAPGAIPAQVAAQTYLDETARQEAVKLQSAVERLMNGYRGERFLTIVYNDMTPEQRQWQWSIQQAGGPRHPIPTPVPPMISEREWIDKCVKNPDPDKYWPVAIVGAQALQSRLGYQQERAQELQRGLDRIASANYLLQTRHNQFLLNLEVLAKTHERLKQRLLDVMRKVELVRCRNLPVQPNEAKLAQQLQVLLMQVTKLAQLLSKLDEQVQSTRHTSSQQQQRRARVVVPDKTQLYRAFTEQRESLTKLSDALQKETGDLSLLQQTVVHGSVPLPPT